MIKREIILERWEHFERSLNRTAASLGITRKTLRYYLKCYGIKIDSKGEVIEDPFDCIRNLSSQEREKWINRDRY